MRIIAGLYKGRRLKTLEGLSIRPTSDRLRETVFNILAPYVEGSRFADLCAGSGAIGIEAFSRGAASVTFVEQSARAVAISSGVAATSEASTSPRMASCIMSAWSWLERAAELSRTRFTPSAAESAPFLPT